MRFLDSDLSQGSNCEKPQVSEDRREHEMIDCQILIVGTTHPIQMRAWGAERSVCDAFREQLIEWCVDEDADAIAEEMSACARKRAQEEGKAHSDKTVPQEAADALGLNHMDCDDDPSIPSIAEMKLSALFRDDDPSKELEHRNTKREIHWVKKLVSWKKNNILFVCGNDHVDSFQEKLSDRGFETKILVENWDGQLS